MRGALSAARALLEAWERFWFEERDGLPLGLVRIGVAGCALLFWVGAARYLVRFYTDAGEFPIAAARMWGPEWLYRVAFPDALGTLAAVVALHGALGLALLALLVGWRTRAAAGVSALLLVWFFLRNPTFLDGGDEVLRLTALYLAAGYLAVAPCDRSLSLDRRRALSGGADPGPARVPAWPLRLVQIQVALVYLVSGFWKVVGEPWWDGRAVYLALANPTFSRFGFPVGPGVRPLLVAFGVTVAFWELLFPLLVTGRRTRIPALAFGVALHVGILFGMNLGIFPLVMLACYPAFLRGEELRRLLRRPARRGLSAEGSTGGGPGRLLEEALLGEPSEGRPGG